MLAFYLLSPMRVALYAYPAGDIEVYASESPYVPEGLVVQMAKALLRPPAPLDENASSGGTLRASVQMARPSGWIFRYAERDLLLPQSGYLAALNEMATKDRITIREWFERSRRVVLVRLEDGREVPLSQLTPGEAAIATNHRARWQHPPLFFYGGPTEYGLSFMRLAARLFPEYATRKTVRRVA
ncbi:MULTISPECIES: hypothetical protein [unclassified Meiothermus]|uniref:hypothetical protein n=1 Tax=unclassified Meiothermus TaxID=370471 RepID=UPI001021FE1B|nr:MULTISPECIES: hypothetical protein [unclassified Meiothermus]RYM36244.1 hypothetical protein EWH23_10580 [Meiothermus sp. PNK-Is4]